MLDSSSNAVPYPGTPAYNLILASCYSGYCPLFTYDLYIKYHVKVVIHDCSRFCLSYGDIGHIQKISMPLLFTASELYM